MIVRGEVDRRTRDVHFFALDPDLERSPTTAEARPLDEISGVRDVRQVQRVVVLGHKPTSCDSTRSRTASSSPVPISTG